MYRLKVEECIIFLYFHSLSCWDGHNDFIKCRMDLKCVWIHSKTGDPFHSFAMDSTILDHGFPLLQAWQEGKTILHPPIKLWILLFYI